MLIVISGYPNLSDSSQSHLSGISDLWHLDYDLEGEINQSINEEVLLDGFDHWPFFERSCLLLGLLLNKGSLFGRASQRHQLFLEFTQFSFNKGLLLYF